MKEFFLICAMILGFAFSHEVLAANTQVPRIWFSMEGMGKPRPSPSWNTLFFESDAPFASWVKFPGRAISDENGLGEDYLVKQYMQSHKTK